MKEKFGKLKNWFWLSSNSYSLVCIYYEQFLSFQDQNESEAILKIKQSMEEESKRFEKDSDHPDYFMQWWKPKHQQQQTTTTFLSSLLLHITDLCFYYYIPIIIYTSSHPKPFSPFSYQTPNFFTFWVQSCENVLVTNDICPMWFFLSISTNEMLKYKPELKYQIPWKMVLI